MSRTALSRSRRPIPLGLGLRSPDIRRAWRHGSGGGGWCVGHAGRMVLTGEAEDGQVPPQTRQYHRCRRG